MFSIPSLMRSQSFLFLVTARRVLCVLLFAVLVGNFIATLLIGCFILGRKAIRNKHPSSCRGPFFFFFLFDVSVLISHGKFIVGRSGYIRSE